MGNSPGITTMNKMAESAEDRAFQRNMMTAFIQIASLVVLVGFSLQIVGPFAGLVLWGIIMAVAIYPVHLKLSAALNGKEKLSVGIMIFLGLALLIVPGWLMTSSSVASITGFAEQVRAGTFSLSAPSQSIADWPVIGERVYATWNAAYEDLEQALVDFQPQIRQLSEWLLRKGGSLVLGVLQFAVSIVIAGVAILHAGSGYQLTCSIARRINPDRGQAWADMSVSTVRSVTNGVLGVALIQAILAGIGFVAIGVPHAGILTGIVLVTSIIQVPALLIIGPVVAWVFSFAEPVPATIFALYSAVVALSDNVLKPILLGRGVDLPAIVVLIGAIGGMIQFGIVGLFVGAVILGLGYTIVSDWLSHPGEPAAAGEQNGDE
jgi:predicted PurR-regulated permease PerM